MTRNAYTGQRRERRERDKLTEAEGMVDGEVIHIDGHTGER